ncbi:MULTISPECIES: hypothetical protein [Streptomyces]|uniref:hypothetical protein n=1 Tax=Streptomyces TaxID=1883 RepID=UPI00093D061C|nr:MULTISPECIES: hypothetical protein [unclassified Streptomyces]QNQ32619.1 hypothetical protein HYC88_02315 [Streptomyces sp. CB00271]
MSYALNRTNHYSGVTYKDDPTIFAWDLMNEPRYEAQSPEEDAEGTTLQAWVDEFGVSQGDPELTVFRDHSAHMAAKSGRTPPATPSPTPTPTTSPTAGAWP